MSYMIRKAEKEDLKLQNLSKLMDLIWISQILTKKLKKGFVRYHDDRIWKQTQKLVREEKEAITKMAVTLTAIRITAMLFISWFALHKYSGQ